VVSPSILVNLSASARFIRVAWIFWGSPTSTKWGVLHPLMAVSIALSLLIIGVAVGVGNVAQAEMEPKIRVKTKRDMHWAVLI
jgi:hypothetical protein